MQEYVAEIRRRLQGKWPHPDPKDSWIWLVTEVGEAGDELMRLTDPHYRRSRQRPGVITALAQELGDIMFMLCTLANHFGIDLDEECRRCGADKLERYDT